MDKIEFLAKIKTEVFDVEDDLKLSSTFKSLGSWDSMTAVFLVEFFMDNFNYSLSSETIQNSATVEDLYNLLN